MTRTSAYLATASRYTRLGIDLVSVIVLARLLKPAEIGEFSVCLAILAIVQVFREFGVSACLVSLPSVRDEDLRTAFGFAILGSWIGGLFFLLGADAAAAFFEGVNISTIFKLIAVMLFLAPLGMPVQAMLTREMRFGHLFLQSTMAVLIQAAVSITLALRGCGSLSLAWGSVASVIVTTVYFAVVAPHRFFILPALRGWRVFASFGAFSSATNMVSQIGINASEVLIGRISGLAAVALYSRANGLIGGARQALEGTAGSVALPALAQKMREGGGSAAVRAYLRWTSLLTGIAWPLYGFIGVVAPPLIIFLYGPDWAPAAPAAQLLAIGNILYAPVLLASPFLIAARRVKSLFFREVALQGARIVLVFLSAPYGFVAVAAAQVAVYFIAAVLNLRLMSQQTGITVTALASSLWQSAAVTAGSLIGPIACTAIIGDVVPIVLLAVAGITSIFGWLIAAGFVQHPIWAELRKAFETICAKARLRELPVGRLR